MYQQPRTTSHNYSHHETNGNSLANPNAINRTQSRYQSTENDLFSVQVTRPTSKTAMLVRQRRSMLEQLSCFLCKGYLIDATTIDECMDSFCKSCIVTYLRDNSNCPRCGLIIHRGNSLSAIRLDKTLQDIVYKLIPGLYDNEMRRRRDFYRGMYSISSEDTEDSEDSSESYSNKFPNTERYGVVSRPKPFYKPSDSIDLSLEPQTRGDSSTVYYDNKRQSIVTCFTAIVQPRQTPRYTNFSAIDSQQFKTYLRCPAKLTATQLKKFITAKFNICRDDTIRLYYLNEPLEDEYSLMDVAYIYDWRGNDHMKLFYKIERDLSVTSSSPDSTRGKVGPRSYQSVGTSTQTTKRVCIDPEPKFYQEQNNNNIVASNPSGRSMRPRQTAAVNPGLVNSSNQITKAPILRSQPTRATSSSATRQSNQATAFSYRGSQDQRPTIDSTRQRDVATTPQTRQCSVLSSTASPRSKDKFISDVQRPRDGFKADHPVQTQMPLPQEINRQHISKFQVQIESPGTSRGSTMTSTGYNETASAVAKSSNSMNQNRMIGQMDNSTNKQVVAYGSKDSNRIVSAKPPSSQPQLFSFVSERGIKTIIRRTNPDDMHPPKSSANTSTPAVYTIAKPSSAPNFQTPRPVSAISVTMNQSVNGPPQSSSSSLGMSTSSGGTMKLDGTSVRHHPKVKPVYKTLVDPTKLKSPNFKKLGYAARH